MNVLIELYDTNDSLNNMLVLSAVKPDRVYVLGGAPMERSSARRLFEKVAKEIKAAMDVIFLPCLSNDLDMLTETMTGILERHSADNVILDGVGGECTYLLEAGACWQRYPAMQLIAQRKRDRTLFYVNGPLAEQTIPVNFCMNVRQAIAFAGGELIRCGHADWRKLDEKMLALIPRVFQVYRRFRSYWPRFVNYLQQMNTPEYAAGRDTYTAPVQLSVGKGRRITADEKIFAALKEAGALKEFAIDGELCTARFYSSQLLKFLCDVGAWLELYLFYVMHTYKLVSDYELNAVISWEEGDRTATINEIDLIAVNGLTQLFISCKSGTPDNAALNEIATLTGHFGTRYARPVLATACNLAKDAPAVYRRASEMGITVLDAPLLADEQELQYVLSEISGNS